MATRRTKPIHLKAAEREHASTVSAMLAALEEKRASGRKHRKPAIWTEEFLASGKPAS